MDLTRETLSDQIVRTVDDALMRVGASANCYDVPADANSGAEYVAMRVRQVLATHIEKQKQTIAVGNDVERFYFLDSYADKAFICEADHERVVSDLQSQLEQLRAENEELAGIVITHGDTIVKLAERFAQVEQERDGLRTIAEGALRFRVEMNGACNHDEYMTKLCTQCEIRAALEKL